MPKTTSATLRLGATSDDGIAPTMYGLLDRGVRSRPELARQMRGRGRRLLRLLEL